MSAFLLDTNVLSESSRQATDPTVVNWLTSTPDELLFTSVLPLAEIRPGIELLDVGRRRAELEIWFVNTLLPSFQSRILPVNRSIGDRRAVVSEQLQRKGRQIASIDGLIAATAVENGLTVVTRNVDDFGGFGAPVFNPWQADLFSQFAGFRRGAADETVCPWSLYISGQQAETDCLSRCLSLLRSRPGSGVLAFRGELYPCIVYPPASDASRQPASNASRHYGRRNRLPHKSQQALAAGKIM